MANNPRVTTVLELELSMGREGEEEEKGVEGVPATETGVEEPGEWGRAGERGGWMGSMGMG